MGATSSIAKMDLKTKPAAMEWTFLAIITHQGENRKMPTHRSHTVWRHYLEAWQNQSGLVHFSRNGEILPPSNPVNVMVARHTYKLPRITKTDVRFLELFIEQTGYSALRASHQKLIDSWARISQANELIRNKSGVSDGDRRYVEGLVIDAEEMLHSKTEDIALPILAALRQKRNNFLYSYEEAILFFHFIAHQYFRTEPVREAIGETLVQEFPGHDFDRLRNIISYMGAENVGASLFLDRKTFDIVFAENRYDLGFITGDQPVVNLLGTGDGSETKELAFYYPLSPHLSCVLAPKSYRFRSGSISSAIVQELNALIAWESKQFLVANSDAALQNLPSLTSLSRPSAGRILDSLV